MTRAPARSRDSQAPRRQRGLATVEFVATAPFVLFLVLACSEIGRAFIHYATLTYAVRDATRFVSTHSINGTTGVVQLGTNMIAEAKNIAVYGTVSGGSTPRLPSFQPSQVAVADVGNSNIEVTATYPYQPMLGAVLPGLLGSPINLGFTMVVAVTMRAIS
jgi:Flp pilus assembly protein TadG